MVDFYDAEFYEKETQAGMFTANPQAAFAGSYKHVVRGGSWNSDVDELRTTARFRALPNAMSGDVGFRCAVPAP